MNPHIDCVTITHSRPTTLEQCIESVRIQVGVEKRHIVVVDRNLELFLRLQDEAERRNLKIAFFPSRRSSTDYDHLIDLRRFATNLTSGPLVAFLDDDDEWDSDHLQTLASEIGSNAGILAGARVLMPDGRPALLDEQCPWASSKLLARSQFEHFCSIGVYERGTNHSFPVIYGSEDALNIHLLSSASLFDGFTLRAYSFRHFTEAQHRGGDIHDLCSRIISDGAGIKCIRNVTMTYRLGGFSNARLQL